MSEKALVYEFEIEEGREELRNLINPVLSNYGIGWELSEKGYIRELPPSGLQSLVNAPLPETTDSEVARYVDTAIDRFLSRKATDEDRLAALRELASALEKLRPEAEKCLTKKDEGDLFAILNGFGIRHANHKQQTDYDKEVFYEWMFYYYLASIRALTRIIDREPELQAQSE
jgi:hypothetical protein